MVTDYETLWGFHENPSKHVTVFSPKTANITKLTSFTANTKIYGRTTLNTKPNSDPHESPHKSNVELN